FLHRRSGATKNSDGSSRLRGGESVDYWSIRTHVGGLSAAQRQSWRHLWSNETIRFWNCPLYSRFLYWRPGSVSCVAKRVKGDSGYRRCHFHRDRLRDSRDDLS